MERIGFKSRDCGLDCNFKNCYACGCSLEKYANHNLSGFVESKEQGESAVKLFREGSAWLDYREREPNWIQVKIGACEDCKDCLNSLNKLTRVTSTINSLMINNSIVNRKYVNTVVNRPEVVIAEVTLRYIGEIEVCFEHENKRLDAMPKDDFFDVFKLKKTGR